MTIKKLDMEKPDFHTDMKNLVFKSERLEYREGMRILFDEDGGKGKRGLVFIEVDKNRAVIAFVGKDNGGNWHCSRLPVMYKSYASCTHYIHAYIYDHIQSEDDEETIKAALDAELIEPPLMYEMFHLFTKEEYDALTEEDKKKAAWVEDENGNVIGE